ncbi:MAG: hypothetical protein GF383_10680, partial [Candidatus Lokiarchaeota archaeon]|nr:hypothetical protein [Candidatus Lokiarchaeota archaeon]MBD3341038.1 hypothetical protein [Candidatus Lokiarchaeota archaeon]
MSLKEFTKEIFTRYGLTEEEIKVYLIYLRVPRATLSEVYMHLEGEDEEEEVDYDKIVEITDKLVQNGFLKKIEGIVDRYIPLEPFFELFTNESELFRNEIAQIKDNILADQSSRFEKLESIQNESIDNVYNPVGAQVKAFFDDSDAKDTQKKDMIDKATNRFTETSKTLEKQLHNTIEEDYTRLQDDVNRIDKESASVWDKNSQKFTADNNNLNQELTSFTKTETSKLTDLVKSENDKLIELTKTQVDASKAQEGNIHGII